MTNNENQLNAPMSGGVWVACRERLPEERHYVFDWVVVKDTTGCVTDHHKEMDFDFMRVTHWLDTTQPIMTVAEHNETMDSLRNEVASVLVELDNLANVWGDEGVFRRCRDRLRKAITEHGDANERK